MDQVTTLLDQTCGSGVWQPPFRGEIAEYAAKLNLQRGYAVKGAVDIQNTARHLTGVLEALRDPKVRLVAVLGAVQTLKSLIADIVVPYWIEHDPGDILWLFEDDPKAKLYAETRAMPMITSKPEIQALLRDVDRNDRTKTKIKFSHCSLVVGGLNEGNVQSISYRYVIVDEAWMARANGLIRQAKDRTTQYPETKKIILLGQGGWEDEDFDIEFRQTDQRVLTYACPFCGYRQPFELARLRTEEHPRKELHGTYSGLSWDTNERTRQGDRWNFSEVGKSAHHRCYQCDARIEDRPAVRRQLHDSYEYQVTNPGAESGLVGFQWPAEASTRIPFADLAVRYLKAKVAKEELGYHLPMQEFYQKQRGEVWRTNTGQELRIIASEPYDPNSEWPEELHRPMIVDCQRDLEKFFWSVFGVAASGEARELGRGQAGSFEELGQIQGKWKVKDQQVFLDCGYEMTKVLRECVKHGHVGGLRIGKAVHRVWLCWTGLKGSGQEMWRHENPKTEVSEWRIHSERKFYNTNVGTSERAPRAPWYEWGNLHCKDILRPRRDGDKTVPSLRFLPDDLPNEDQWSHFAQMRSEKRVEKYQGGKKKSVWELVRETRPNHEWDKAAMLMAFMAIAGIIAAPQENEEPPPLALAEVAPPAVDRARIT